MSGKNTSRCVLISVVAATSSAWAGEAAYPVRAIRMIVPSTPGGVTDVAARAVADVMRELLGNPVVIDNRPGAAGRFAAELAARAPSDGHTLFVPNGSAFSIASAMDKSLPYDVLRDFDSVSLLAELPGVLAVHPSVPARSVADLVAIARSQPGKLGLSTSGIGSGGHVVALRMGSISKIEFLHVPYKGEAQALIDTVGGQVPIVIGSAIKPYVDSGRLRPIAGLGRVRSIHFPDLPTLIEQGYPGVFQVSWNGVSVPKGTASPVIAKLNQVINASLKSPRIVKVMADNGFTITGGNPSKMADWVESEIERYRAIVAEYNIPKN